MIYSEYIRMIVSASAITAVMLLVLLIMSAFAIAAVILLWFVDPIPCTAQSEAITTSLGISSGTHAVNPGITAQSTHG